MASLPNLTQQEWVMWGSGKRQTDKRPPSTPPQKWWSPESSRKTRHDWGQQMVAPCGTWSTGSGHKRPGENLEKSGGGGGLNISPRIELRRSLPTKQDTAVTMGYISEGVVEKCRSRCTSDGYYRLTVTCIQKNTAKTPPFLDLDRNGDFGTCHRP